MQTYFINKQTKRKYFYKIFDLDANELNTCLDETRNTIEEWYGGQYMPDFYINICVDDTVKLSQNVTNNFKDGLARIFSSSWAFIMTSKKFKLN